MNTKKNVHFLGATALCGLAAGVLRLVMMKTGLDDRGLLEQGNPWGIAILVLSLGYLVVMAWMLRRLGGSGSYEENFPKCKLRMVLGLAGGVIFMVESLRQLMLGQAPIGVLGLAAGGCMIFTGICRGKGNQPSPAFHVMVCLFYILRLILSFQRWSADPQLEDYALQTLACVSLMLFSFYRASWDAGLINPVNRIRMAFFGLAAAYFCLASLSDESSPLLYLASVLWTVGAMPNLAPLPEDEK